MALSGKLAEFSLPEIFQFLEQGQKTGLLKINSLDTNKFYYIWLQQGRIVAAADRLDQQGLLSLLTQRNWLSDRVSSKIPLICSMNTPLGLCLKSQGLLQAEQLKLLFRSQVVTQIATLFELSDGKFEFEPITNLPLAEMTGISLPATEATLLGLRALRDWTALAEKLPDPTYGLCSLVTVKPEVRLDSLEWQVWEFAKGTVSLQEIAKQLGLPITTVQQIAFRLIVINLAEEVFLVEPVSTASVAVLTPPIDHPPEPGTAKEPDHKNNVSKSFLTNLVGFLRGKV